MQCDIHCCFRLRFHDTSLICRNRRYGQTRATCCGREGPTAYSISFRIILKCDNEPSTKSLHYAVIQGCAGVEVSPLGPPDGDHMANGRVEVAVREVKRQDTPDLR